MHIIQSFEKWNLVRKIAFRFTLVFFTLIVFPFPLSVIPGIKILAEKYLELWVPLVRWVGKRLLGIEQYIQYEVTGSGDKLYDWVWYATIILLTLVIGTIFSIADRRRSNYTKLKSWFLLLLSYYLSYNLLNYGIIKLFHLQFVPPGLSQLFHTYGQSSPMHLVWTFMGTSAAYTIFAGFCETLAGALLLFRRTRTVGAMMSLGVMTNVFLLNMSYDIPVKLFSFQLVVISGYILAQEWQRLFTFFFTDSTTLPLKAPGVVNTVKAKRILIVAQTVLVALIIISQIMLAVDGRKTYGVEREKSVLYGIYNVESYVRDGKTVPDLLSNPERWKRLIFDHPEYAVVTMMDDRELYLQAAIDTSSQTILITNPYRNLTNQKFTYESTDSSMVLNGAMGNDTLNIRLQQYDLSRFGLLNRGFHWVNEVPYNRYNRD